MSNPAESAAHHNMETQKGSSSSYYQSPGRYGPTFLKLLELVSFDHITIFCTLKKKFKIM